MAENSDIDMDESAEFVLLILRHLVANLFLGWLTRCLKVTRMCLQLRSSKEPTIKVRAWLCLLLGSKCPAV